MKKQISLLAAAAALMMATQAHAQNGTQFVPGATGGTGAQNPDGSYVHPTGLAQDGNPNQFSVGGNIAEFIEITSIDSALEMGDLGGPEKVGNVKSASGAGTDSSATEVTRTSGNGTAGVELDSNAYVRIEAQGGNMVNLGPDNTAGGGDDYTLPTSYRVAAKGRRFSVNNGAYSAINPSPAYTAYGSTVAPATATSVTFSPGAFSGLKVMSEVTRDGLNNYRGDYTATINLSYSKF